MSGGNDEFNRNQQDFAARLAKVAPKEPEPMQQVAAPPRSGDDSSMFKIGIGVFVAVALVLAIFVVPSLLKQKEQEGSTAARSADAVSSTFGSLGKAIGQKIADMQPGSEILPTRYLPDAPSGWQSITGAQQRDADFVAKARADFEKNRSSRQLQFDNLLGMGEFAHLSKSKKQGINMAATSILYTYDGKTAMFSYRFDTRNLPSGEPLTDSILKKAGIRWIRLGRTNLITDGFEEDKPRRMYARFSAMTRLDLVTNATDDELDAMLKTIDFEKLRTIVIP